jgi:hypothetical protein
MKRPLERPHAPSREANAGASIVESEAVPYTNRKIAHRQGAR